MGWRCTRSASCRTPGEPKTDCIKTSQLGGCRSIDRCLVRAPPHNAINVGSAKSAALLLVLCDNCSPEPTSLPPPARISCWEFFIVSIIPYRSCTRCRSSFSEVSRAHLDHVSNTHPTTPEVEPSVYQAWPAHHRQRRCLGTVFGSQRCQSHQGAKKN